MPFPRGSVGTRKLRVMRRETFGHGEGRVGRPAPNTAPVVNDWSRSPEALRLSLSSEFAEQLVDIEDRLIHHAFAGSDFGEADARVGAVASFGRGFDRREIHAVAVAVAEEERVLDVCAGFQAVSVVAEKLARAANQGDLAVQHDGVQLGGEGIAVELLVGVRDLGKKASLEGSSDRGLFQVDAGLEVKRVDHALHARLRGTSVFTERASAMTWSARVSPKPLGPGGPDPTLGLMSPEAPCMKTHLAASSDSTLFLRKPG